MQSDWNYWKKTIQDVPNITLNLKKLLRGSINKREDTALQYFVLNRKEEKMLNKERFKEKIWDYISKHGQMPAITKEGLKKCKLTNCANDRCFFYRPHLTCEEGLIEWLNSEYVEPKTDWSKVSVDTAVIVSNDEETWYNRYFARYENNKVNTWSFGNTSWSAEDGSDFVSWAYAKLANAEDIEKYRKE